MGALANINPVYFLEPVSSIAIVLGLLILYRKKGLTAEVALLAALSYFSAIAAKSILQYFTFPWMENVFGYTSIPTALYFGSQTAVFEIFGAYLVARHWKKHIRQRSAEAYGLSLAFMENAILIGGIALINLTANYFVIASGQTSLAQYVHDQLMASKPALFYGTLSALPIVGYSVLERTSSLILHFSWGFLTVTSVSTGKVRYLLAALPFGFVDGLVPYSSAMGIPLFEATVFVISIIALAIALLARKKIRKNSGAPEERPTG